MKHSFSINRLASAAMLCTAIAMAGCASAPVPDEQLAVAQSAVTRASTAATSEVAGDQLRLAVSKLARARAAVAAGDPEGAKRYAEQAELDAQVAEMHAQTVRSRKAAQESEDASRVLREEINRKSAR